MTYEREIHAAAVLLAAKLIVKGVGDRFALSKEGEDIVACVSKADELLKLKGCH